MTKNIRCHLCGHSYATAEFYPACSQEHLDKLRSEVGQAVYSPVVAKEAKIKLWATFINHSYSAWSALFELITGFKPPKLKDLLPLMSGHH